MRGLYVGAQLGVVAEHASIHHHRDAGLLRAQRGGLVHHAVLQPQLLDAEPDTALHDGGHMLGRAKHIHDVDRERDTLQIGISLFAKDFGDERPHRHDAVAETLQGAGDVEAGTGCVGRQADHGDRVRFVQQATDILRAGVVKGHVSFQKEAVAIINHRSIHDGSQVLSAIHASQLTFFAAHAPFDRFEGAHQVWLLERLKLAYYAKGEVIASPAQGRSQRFFIIKQGLVRGARQGEDSSDAVIELHEGESFPVGALLAGRAVTSTYRAAEDVFCFELDAADFHALLELSPVFKDFCTRRITALFEQSHQAMRAQFAQAATEQQSLSSPLSEILRREPVTCAPDTALLEVLRTMRELRVGSMVVVDAQRKPLGIFTLNDLLGRVVLPGLSTDVPISQVMSPEPMALPPTAPAYEAAMAMARAGFRHVLVTEADGTLSGILSERDLFSLQRVGLRQISGALRQAADVETLVGLSRDIRALARNMMAQGVAAEQLTLFISTLNDLLAARLIELECAASALIGTPLYDNLCWLVMGSGGRYEQTLNTDQDNALIFSLPDGMSADEARAILLPVALRINQAMSRCGFPLCKGNIMASNPKWCLSLEEWQEVFTKWVDQGSPEALLHASIFFDFRALAGQRKLAETLRNWLAQLARGNSRFLHQMAANAMRNRPPLGVVRDFVLNDAKRIDLKLNGLAPFVDAARIFSLAAGATQTSTIQRLRQSAAALHVPEAEVEAWIDAFLFIQMLRLRHHYEASATLSEAEIAQLDNLIDPAVLNELDRRILKESFRQARKVQAKLALDYQL